jgi:hypothetical protein
MEGAEIKKPFREREWFKLDRAISLIAKPRVPHSFKLWHRVP